MMPVLIKVTLMIMMMMAMMAMMAMAIIMLLMMTMVRDQRPTSRRHGTCRIAEYEHILSHQ